MRCDDLDELASQCQKNSTACFDKCCLPCEKGMSCDDPTTNTLKEATGGVQTNDASTLTLPDKPQ